MAVMIDHRLTIDLYDQHAEVLAASWETGRVIIRWGTGIESCVSALRFDVESGWWRRETVPRGYRLEALAGPAGDRYCRDLGLVDGDVSCQPAGASSSAAQISRVVSWLAVEASQLSPRWAWLARVSEIRPVAAWLLTMSQSLGHGFDLIEVIAAEGSPSVGGGGYFDDLLGVLVRLEVIYPHAFMPRPGAIFVNDAWQARAFGRRVAPETFGAGTAERERDGWEPGAACGAKHWMFQQGRKFRECVGSGEN